MDAVVKAGVIALGNHTPAALPAGSDTANLSLLGYDPLTHYTGRAPLEAAAQGIALASGDWAVRCNLVTIEDQVMRDFTAGHVSTEEAAALLGHAAGKGRQRYVAIPARSQLSQPADRQRGPFHATIPAPTPPHDLTDQSILDGYPRGPGSSLLADLMSTSESVFADHPVNQARRKAGKRPVTNVWLWGQGSAPRLEPFEQLYGVRGAMITAVDLLRGLAKLIGWKRIDVPGATGYLDTDYAAKGRYAVEALKEHDLVCVHVEAPDEASHEGRADAKIEALEQIDRHIVGPAVRGLARLSAVADPRLARSSHAPAHEDAQPRQRADRDCRQRHSSPTVSTATTIPRRRDRASSFLKAGGRWGFLSGSCTDHLCDSHRAYPQFSTGRLE